MKLSTYRFLLLILILAAPACCFAQAIDSAEYFAARQCIDDGNRQWIKGWESGDASIVAAIFCQDGRMLSGAGIVVSGKAAIQNRLQMVMNSLGSGVKVEVKTTRIWLDGDYAYETGQYAYHYKMNNRDETDSGKYFTQWKKLPDGSWKLWLDAAVP